jgi:hypothetical protein
MSGDGALTGSVAQDGTMRVSTSDVWRCPAGLDATPTSSQQSEFDRALTLSFVAR